MTPISGQIELLASAVEADRILPGQIGQRLSRIRRAMHHFMNRAEILLDLSRIVDNKLRLDPQMFDLGVLLHGMVEDHAVVAQRAGVLLALTAPDQLSVTLDRMALEQIVENLISNAIRYGAHTPIEVMAKEDGGSVRIRVSDGGAGIPAADRERLSGRFERAVGAGKQRSGFGVGLWLVGQLVAAMEGTVTIDDAAGGGAVFTVTLPQHLEGTHS